MSTAMHGPDRSQAAAGELAFSRAAHALPDEALAGPSLLPGWDRATLLSHVAGNALAFTRAVTGAAAGGDTRMYDSREQRNAQIAEQARLAPAALRALSDDAAAGLAAAWNVLTPEQWSLSFTNGQGRPAPLAGTVKGRAREIWVHLVDLDAGPTFADVPADITDAVLREVWASWVARGADEGLAISTEASDGAPLTLGAAEAPGVVLVTGSLAAVTGWATGRTRDGVTAVTAAGPAPLPAAPDWI
ncbi:MAG: maleylpyruvate isomerase family mycothiol-dependent enzyme [Arthrobacter sp.]|jgi:maleylpyruvate isomerase|nr:maleylpyruvate isomerase family mycothiol-dependent enzyme [Arthrobacter sp.]